MDKCLICDNELYLNDTSNIRQVKQTRGLTSLEEAATKREDKFVLDNLRNIQLPFYIHKDCGCNYTRNSSIQSALKRKISAEDGICGKDIFEPVSSKLRSNTIPFKAKQFCFFCTEEILDQTKINVERRRPVSDFMTLCPIKLLMKFNENSNETFVEEVKLRYEAMKTETHDLPSAEAKYHRDCYSEFLKHGRQIQKNKGCAGRPDDANKNDAFERLVQYLAENDECQYSFHEIHEKMKFYAGENKEIYTLKHTKNKLIDYFGDKIIITYRNTAPSVITFKDHAFDILRDTFKQKSTMNVNEEKNLILDMAAAIIRDSIRSKVYSMHDYPKMDSLNSTTINEDIPTELTRFLSGIIRSKVEANAAVERRKSAIAHSIVSACRPRSFISSLMLSLSTYVHRKYESRELIDILSSLGYGESYAEVSHFLDCILSTTAYTDQLSHLNTDAFQQFVFDNADWNTKNDTGRNTWHVMGGIAAVTPADAIPEVETIKRYSSPQLHSQNALIPILNLPDSETRVLLNNVCLEPLPDTCMSSMSHVISDLDNLWLYFQALQRLPNSLEKNTPGWAGFMKKIFSQNSQKPGKIIILPFALGIPSNLNTIFSCLMYAREKCKMSSLIVTFDQPLFVKAITIVESFPNLFKNCLIKLGEFHMIMSYLGCIGFLMSESGLDKLWNTVYAPVSVGNMLTGHAYQRALAAHFSTVASLFNIIYQSSADEFKTINPNQLYQLIQDIEGSLFTSESIVNDQSIMNLRNMFESLKKKISSQSLTSKLWIMYMELVLILKLFIAAIRLGNIELYEHCLCKMIPIFHSAGHLAYAKCTRFYLQKLRSCKDWMEQSDYTKFMDEGKIVIRRIKSKWGGNESDKVIEQDLMRLIKSKGGLVHGRGITDSTMEKFTNTFPATVPICKSLESFCNVHFQSSEQHKDLRPVSCRKLSNTISVFVDWLNQHSPFNNESTELINIADGTVASSDVNCYQAFEIGCRLAANLDNIPFSEAKLHVKEKAITISYAANSIKCRNRIVEINPQILFHRICCVIEKKEEMEEYLKFELSQQPPSIFKKGMMRKNEKSDLCKIIKSSSTEGSFAGNNFIIDGGNLLYNETNWEKNLTFAQICNGYLNFLLALGESVTVIFDGYNFMHSTKLYERNNRSKGKASKTYLFDLSMKVQVSKLEFLSNYANKSRLIDFLIPIFEENSIKTMQAEADADYLIASKSLESSLMSPTLCIATDTDILVMLVTDIDVMCKGLFFGKSKNTCYNVLDLNQSLSAEMRYILSILHGFSDNDTTSGFFGKGKKTLFDLVNTDSHNFGYLLDMHHSDKTPDEVEIIGQKFIFSLYRGNLKINECSLERLRYDLYYRAIGKAKLTSQFDLRVLPPTSSAARQHSLRAYHTIQQWKGHILNPCDWGWEMKDGKLIPITDTKPPLPDKLNKMISCSCKTGCGNRCGCRRFGLECSVLCKNCNGIDCTNSKQPIHAEDE